MPASLLDSQLQTLEPEPEEMLAVITQGSCGVVGADACCYPTPACWIVRDGEMPRRCMGCCLPASSPGRQVRARIPDTP